MFFELVAWALPLLPDLGDRNGGPHRRTYERWATKKGPTLQAKNAGAAAQEICERCQSSELQSELEKQLKATFPNPPSTASPKEFGDWFRLFVARARVARLGRRRKRPAKRAPDIASVRKKSSSDGGPEAQEMGPAQTLEPASIPGIDDPVAAYVDKLFAEAGIPVHAGRAMFDSKTFVALEPLYRYLRELQSSAKIPNYFPGLPSIRLDDLYVELSAAEDHRADSLDLGGASGGAVSGADPVGAWRTAVSAKRVPLETLISATDLRPAVLFGDPGSGKSTLLHYALHALGRGAVGAGGIRVPGILPFRISLREFAKEGVQDEFEVIRYIIRRILGVTDPGAFEDWRCLLSHFFNNKRPFRMLLLVDGIDEITPDPLEFEAIQTKLEEASAIARMVFTSRRAGFERPVPHYSPFELVELSEVAIQGLIANWYLHVHPRPAAFIESFQRWIFSDPRRQEMASNPCLLSLLCFLNQECTASHFIQARNRAELYGRAVEKLAADPRRPRGTSDSPALQTLSAFALDRYLNLGTEPVPLALFNREEVRQFLERPTSPEARAKTGSGLEVLDLVWLRTRLVSQWNLGTWYHFLHLSFQEYFAARHLATVPEGEVAELIRRHRFNPYWREIWRFYSGLCALSGGGGRSRFMTLARSHVEPRDLYDQTLFHLAPLCAEFGLRDTRRSLGFDLRTALLQKLEQGHNQTRAHIRRMVDVDPQFFLQHARSTLAPHLDRYRVSAGEPPPATLDSGEARLAVTILECIYHPDALRFHGELIEAEIGCPWLRRFDPAMGPTSPSGRNQALGALIETCVRSASGDLQRERGINYLACVRTTQAATSILEIARAAGTNVAAGRSRAKAKSRALEFQVHCIWALCELGASEAVQLARELWPDPGFREGHIGEVATFLSVLRSPDVATLAEEWLNELAPSGSATTLEPLLELLKPWAEREVPPGVVRLLDPPHSDPEIRASAWEVRVLLGRFQAREPLRDHVRALAASKALGESELVEVAAIVEFIGRGRLPFSRELEALRQHPDCAASPFVSDALWCAMTCVHAAFASSAAHKRWLSETALPAFEQALRRPGQEVGRISHWLAAFRFCDEVVLAGLSGIVESVWECVDDDARSSLLQFFVDSPSMAPARAIQAGLRSDHTELRTTAVELQADLDPGWLMAQREGDAVVEEVLFGRSVRDGTLYFADGYYSPADLDFKRYAHCGIPN
jgi:hypothetical protein